MKHEFPEPNQDKLLSRHSIPLKSHLGFLLQHKLYFSGQIFPVYKDDLLSSLPLTVIPDVWLHGITITLLKTG